MARLDSRTCCPRRKVLETIFAPGQVAREVWRRMMYHPILLSLTQGRYGSHCADEWSRTDEEPALVLDRLPMILRTAKAVSATSVGTGIRILIRHCAELTDFSSRINDYEEV